LARESALARGAERRPRIPRIASVTSGKLDAPRRAEARAADGSVARLEGARNGASTVNLFETRQDIEG
jgi:hypothetical protein